MHILELGSRINNRNSLGHLLNQTNGGPWFAVAVYPKGIVVDKTTGWREEVVVYGGKNLSEYRRRITFAPIKKQLLSYAGNFAVKVWFDGKYLVAKVALKGEVACGKIYLETGIIWSEVLEQIRRAIQQAKDNYWRMNIICFKVLDGTQAYVRAARAMQWQKTQLFFKRKSFCKLNRYFSKNFCKRLTNRKNILIIRKALVQRG